MSIDGGGIFTELSLPMNIRIRQATAEDAAGVSAVLTGAAEWLAERGIPMWRAGELAPDIIAADVASGEFYVAVTADGSIAGTVKFQLEDALFWPDEAPGRAAYVHRLAVRRDCAGGAVSAALLTWAAERAREFKRPFLRLDCDAERAKLRAVYERQGFRHHSDRQVGPYFVARYELALI